MTVDSAIDTAVRSRPGSIVRPVDSNYRRSALYALAAVSIWAGWSAMTRRAVTTGLDAWDIPALRFGVAGVLLFPVVVRRGLAFDRLGWLGLGGLVAGTGALYALSWRSACISLPLTMPVHSIQDACPCSSH